MILFKFLRITPLLSNRYGHLIINPEIYFLEKQNSYEKNKKYFDLFFTVRFGICKLKLLKLWKKKLV